MLRALSEKQAVPSAFTVEINTTDPVLQPTFTGNACQNAASKVRELLGEVFLIPFFI